MSTNYVIKILHLYFPSPPQNQASPNECLRYFLPTFSEISVPPTVRPALQNLCDTLGYHTTITVWDQMFRLAYTAAFECRSKPSSAEVGVFREKIVKKKKKEI